MDMGLSSGSKEEDTSSITPAPPPAATAAAGVMRTPQGGSFDSHTEEFNDMFESPTRAERFGREAKKWRTEIEQTIPAFGAPPNILFFRIPLQQHVILEEELADGEQRYHFNRNSRHSRSLNSTLSTAGSSSFRRRHRQKMSTVVDEEEEDTSTADEIQVSDWLPWMDMFDWLTWVVSVRRVFHFSHIVYPIPVLKSVPLLHLLLSFLIIPDRLTRTHTFDRTQFLTWFDLTYFDRWFELVTT